MKINDVIRGGVLVLVLLSIIGCAAEGSLGMIKNGRMEQQRETPRRGPAAR